MLVEKLEEAVKSCNTLEELVNTFFQVAGEAKRNPKEEYEYVGGTVPYMAKCMFGLMYQIPLKNGEFDQLDLDVFFDIQDEVVHYDHKVYGPKDGDLKEFIFKSESYNVLKDKKILKVEVNGGET